MRNLLATMMGVALLCVRGAAAVSDAYTVPYHALDAAGGHAASGDYAVDASLGGVGGLGQGRPAEAALRAGYAAQLNDPPTTSGDTLPRPFGEGLSIAFSILLANDHDTEADVLSILSVTSPSPRGAVVHIEGSTIRYEPPADLIDEDTVDYIVIDAFGGTARGMATLKLTARPPVAGADAVRCVAGRVTKFPLATLLANDTVDSTRTPSITAVSSTSANGASLANEDGVVLYIPANSDEGTDSFTYTLSDGVNTDTGTVTVTLEAVPATQTRNIKRATLTGPPENPQVNIEAAGIPGRRYRLQMTASLTAPINWTNLGDSQTAPTNGQLAFTDSAPESPRFYRMIEVP